MTAALENTKAQGQAAGLVLDAMSIYHKLPVEVLTDPEKLTALRLAGLEADQELKRLRIEATTADMMKVLTPAFRRVRPMGVKCRVVYPYRCAPYAEKNLFCKRPIMCRIQNYSSRTPLDIGLRNSIAYSKQSSKWTKAELYVSDVSTEYGIGFLGGPDTNGSHIIYTLVPDYMMKDLQPYPLALAQ